MTESISDPDPVLDGIATILRRHLTPSDPMLHITSNMSLIDDLDLDSPSMIDVHLDLEEQFGIALSNREMQSAFTVADLRTLVTQKQMSR